MAGSAVAIAAQTSQRFFDADLDRLDGDLLLATGNGVLRGPELIPQSVGRRQGETGSTPRADSTRGSVRPRPAQAHRDHNVFIIP